MLLNGKYKNITKSMNTQLVTLQNIFEKNNWSTSYKDELLTNLSENSVFDSLIVNDDVLSIYSRSDSPDLTSVLSDLLTDMGTQLFRIESYFQFGIINDQLSHSQVELVMMESLSILTLLELSSMINLVYCFQHRNDIDMFFHTSYGLSKVSLIQSH